jgi:hypothetical protein
VSVGGDGGGGGGFLGHGGFLLIEFANYLINAPLFARS